MKMEEMPLSGLDNSKLEAVAHDMYTELVDDACLGLCFEVHRAVKCGYFFLDDTDPDSTKDFEIVDQPGVDIFGQVYNQWKNKECVCPNCSRSIAAARFAPHLEKCLGMGRNSSRIANRRIASSNTLNKSESDQEDNDDINDNDWSYGSEKKGGGGGEGGGGFGVKPARNGKSHVFCCPIAKKRKSDKNPNSPRRSKSLKHKNGDIGGNPDPFKYSNSTGINYETLGPEELRTLLTTQCGVISEHTKKMCTRSLRCPQHTDEQRRSVRVYLLGPSACLPEAEAPEDPESLEAAESQSRALLSRLHWDSSDLSPADSGSSKASTNPSESRKAKKKKPHLGLGGAPALGGSNKKKKPKPPHPHPPSIYDDIN
ncbi:ataxin-7-like protein 3 isoform X1 [Melopsittacus undulatus]|uniref:ataxin-7-like protein 3 isoform X1 n=1 Tax=Melopsittacus undulatus TaxID=13146 RepID=UPI00146BC9DC|nr:ataxin-7-like protein 3 isoform X1 [Melopsittacus undulatus]